MTKRGKLVLFHLIAIPTLALGVWWYTSTYSKVSLNKVDYGQKAAPTYQSMVRIQSESGLCTATVFSKNYAITAGHCVYGHVKQKFKIYGTRLQGTLRSELVTEAVGARVVMYGGIDLGLLKGNFEQFHYAQINFGDLVVMRAGQGKLCAVLLKHHKDMVLLLRLREILFPA
jgi:hypothetical protein